MIELCLEDVLSDDWGKEEVNTNSAVKRNANDDTIAGGEDSSEFLLSQFLDEIIDLPIQPKPTTKSSKSVIVKRNIPLGDITNQQQQQKTLTRGKETIFAIPAIPPSKTRTKISNTQQAPLHTLTSTQQIARMDSLDDGIWSDIDNDMLTLMESGGNLPTNNLQAKNTAKDAIDKEFNSRFEATGASYTPSFSTARGKQMDMPSTQAILKAKSVLESADSNDTPKDPSSSQNNSVSHQTKAQPPPPPPPPPANFMISGFLTAKGKQWTVSVERLKEAELKFKAYNDTFVPSPDQLPIIELSRDDDRVKRHKSSGDFTEEEQDTKLPDFDDEPAPEPTNSLEAPSKEKSSHVLSKEESLKRLADGNLKYDTVKHLGGFTMGFSGKAFDISSQVRRDAVSKFEQSELSHQKEQQLSSFSIGAGSKLFQSPVRTAGTSTTTFQEPSPPFQSPYRTTLASPFRSLSPSPSNDKSPLPLPKQQRNNNRVGQLRVANKPFKSPVRSKEKTKAAADRPSSKKTTSTCVFDLTVPKNRKSLSSLEKPLQYSKQQLVAKNIPIAIINMTAGNAKYYRFDNWGYKEAQQGLLKAGTLPHRTTLAWVENHYGWIVWKKACLVRSWPHMLTTEWTRKTVLDQLLYRYEREMNMGHRPVLKKILEADDISVKHMILVVADIVELKYGSFDKQYNASSKYLLYLSDGWYDVPARIDIRMEKAIKSKKLKIGSKLSICGAQILGEKEGISPLANQDDKAMLSISANGCLPARWDTKLGYHPQKYLTRTLPTIFDDGGTVTALDIIVCRKFPILFSETLSNGSVVIRTQREEQEARQRGMSEMNFKVPHMQQQTNNVPTMEERKVSGYFKMLICDTKSRPDEQWAYLTLSNANEMNHMDIVEGNRYKVFFVVPQKNKQQQQQQTILYLKTTFMTRWEPATAVPLNQCNAYIARYLSSCHQIPRDRSMYFDLAVLVLQTSEVTREAIHGRVLHHKTVLVTDSSQGICQINLHLPSNGLTVGQILGFINLKFVLFDEKFGITHVKATDETEVMYRSPPEYVQRGIKKLREWKQQNPDQVETVTNRIRDIVQ